MDFLDDDDTAPTTMQPVGDFHLRSALQIPDIDEAKRGILRPREKNAWTRLSQISKNLYSEPPARQLGKIFMYLNTRKLPQSHFIREITQTLESETKWMTIREIQSVKKLRSHGDHYEKSINIAETTQFAAGPYSEYRLKLMAAVQYSVSKDTGRITSILHDFFDGELCDCSLLTIGPIILILAGELIGITERQEVAFKSDNHKPEREELMDCRINVQYLDSLRLISDKVSERDNVFIASTIGAKVNPVIYLDPKIVMKVLKVFDRGLIKHGNDFYKAIKVYEALVVGLTLKLENTNFVPEELDYLANTLSDVSAEHEAVCKEMVEVLKRHCFSFQHLSQVHGFFRLWGHPVIDSLAGVEKMRKVGTRAKVTDRFLPIQMGRKFKEKFCLSYYKKNKSIYPKMTILESGSYLTDCLEQNKRINILDPDYHEQDWDNMIFQKTLDIPESYNLSLIVADTAISPNREELKSVEGDRRGALKPEWRRGVIKWIKDGMIDCLLLLLLVNLCPTGLPLIWLIIGLYPKEREVNPIARMFSLMTLMMRAYFVITEEMLSKHVLKHFPNISMTLPLLDLTKKLNLFTRRQQSQKPGGRTFCINMDFEKWNLNFRKEVTFHVFDSLGRLFGLTHLYNRTYDIFRNSLLYLSDGSYMPKFDDQYQWTRNSPQHCIVEHLGGNEGLRQKAWTIATSLMIDIICEEEKIDYKLMGQGDNQVLLVTIYSEKAKLLGEKHVVAQEEIKQKLKKFLSKLYVKSKSIGLPIKPLETWVSDTFFAYGKLPVFKGVVGAQSLKKLARCFPFSNEDIMTLDNALGSITATFNAACAADRNSVVPLWTARFNQMLAIEWFSIVHPLGGVPFSRRSSRLFSDTRSLRLIEGEDIDKANLSDRTIMRCMAIIPKMLGGFNTFNLLGSHFRGIPDPLTHSLTVLKLWKDLFSNPQTAEEKQFRWALDAWYMPFLRKDPHFHQLNNDPYSIPIFQPIGTKMITQRMIRNQVKAISGNSKYAAWFHQLVAITEDENREELNERLTAGETLYPRLNYALIKGSVFGYAESVVSKVDKTVTLSRLTSSKHDVVGTIWKGEEEFWLYFFDRSELKSRTTPESCITRYSQFLRDHGWGKKILGVTCPCSYTIVKPDEGEIPAEHNYVEARTEVNTLLHRDILDTFNGSSVPYLGSEVDEGQSYNVNRVTFGTDPLLSRPISLMRLIGWLIPNNSNWAKLLISNLQSVTDADPQLFIDNDPLFEANSDQKFVEGSNQRGSMWNHLYSVGSHVSINTALWSDAGEKGEYHLQFQSLLCLVQEAMLNNITSSLPRPRMRWVTDCRECFIKSVNKIPDLPEEPTAELFPIHKENPYLFTNSTRVVTIVDKKLEELKALSRISIYDARDPPRLACKLIAEHYALNIVKLLLQGGTDSTTESLMGTNILELRKLDVTLMMKCLCLVLWTTVFSRNESHGRVPNWGVDKELIKKKLMKMDLIAFQGGLPLYQDENTISQLRRCKWFSPPSSYPVNLSHGLVSFKSSLLLYLKHCDRPPLYTWTLAIHRKELDWYRGLYLRRFAQLNSPECLCHECKWMIAVSHWSDFSSIAEVIQSKCDKDHNLFHPHYIRNSVLISDQWDDILQVAVVKQMPKGKTRVNKTEGHSLNHLKESFTLAGFDETELQLTSSDDFLTLPKISSEYNYVPYLLSPISLPTRAYCRIYELLSKIQLEDSFGMKVVVLGDGFGGSSIAAGEILGFSNVACWTLLDNSDSLPKSAHTAVPPSHYLDDRTILNLSNKWHGDIFSNEFSRAWKIDPDLLVVTCILSEIELNHYPEDRTVALTIKQCQILLALGKPVVIIKVAFEYYDDLLQIMDSTRQFPYAIQVIQTPLVDLLYGECWLVFIKQRVRTRRRLNTEEGNHQLSRLLDTKLIAANHFINESLYEESWRIILNSNHPLLLLTWNDAEGWFSSAGISAWDSTDSTLMLNQIRNFKCPEYIFDHAGRKAKYWFHDDAEVLKLRLICLIYARIENIRYVNDMLRNKDGFSIKWCRRIKKANKISYPMLVRNERQPLEEEQVNALAKYIAVVRYKLSIGKNAYPTFYEVKDSVPFKYVSYKEFSGVKKEAYFRVSKTYATMIQ